MTKLTSVRSTPKTSASPKSHEEKRNLLRDEFGRAKERARTKGSVNECSINKICKATGVDKTYLHGHRLKDGKDKDEYLKICDEINKFRMNFHPSKDISEDKIKIQEIEKKYNALLASVNPIQKELLYYRELSNDEEGQLDKSRTKVSELLARVNQLERTIKDSPSPTNVVGTLPERIVRSIVSPDKYRMINGKYRFGDEKLELKAWGKAYGKLEELLSRNLKMRLYILVGMPCSGKTTWAENSVLASDRHPVIFDALNLSAVDRSKLVYALNRFTDLPKVCVYFDTGMEIVRERNRTIRSSDKMMTDDDG